MNMYTKSIFETQNNDLKAKFTDTYIKGHWYDGETRSGRGSSLLYTISFRDNLIKIVKNNNIKTIFDCSCGDWNWMKEVSDNFENYIGNDIVEELVKANNEKFGNERIKFICGDMVEVLKKFADRSIDLIICRQTLEHLTTPYCVNIITEIKRAAKMAIITSATHADNSKANIAFDPDGHSSRQICLDLSPFIELLNAPQDRFWDSVGLQDVNSLEATTGHVYNFTSNQDK